MSGSNAWPGGSDEVETVACVNFSWDPFIGYVGGFAKAGRILVDHVAATDQDQDYLVYPIVFCYRHALEIALKQVIIGSGTLVSAEEDHPDTHRLAVLWSQARRLLCAAIGEDPVAVQKISHVVARLDELDPAGEAFRYPLGRRRNGRRESTLRPELRHVPLAHLGDEIDEALRLLDGADDLIRVLADQQAEAREMQAELNAEMADGYME